MYFAHLMPDDWYSQYLMTMLSGGEDSHSSSPILWIVSSRSQTSSFLSQNDTYLDS